MATGGRSQSKLSGETFDFICTACDKDNRTLEAVRYCVECSGYCCQECTDLHSRFPTLKNHNLLDVGQGNQASKKQPKLPEFPTERCSIHQGKVLDMYCEHHDVVGCSTCISKNHRACPDDKIHFIPEMIDLLFSLKRSKQVQTNLKKLIVSVKKGGSSKDKQLAMLRNSKDEALGKVAKFKKGLETVVKKLAEMSRKDVEEMYTNIEKEILQEKTDLMKINDGLLETRDKLVKAVGNKAQHFACAKIAEKMIPEAEMAVKEKNGDTDFHLDFTPNQLLMNDIISSHGLGVSKMSRYKKDLYKVKESEDIYIKTVHDLQTCDVEDCCLTHDNRLLLADGKNENLKLLDLETLSVVGVCILMSAPSGVCSINENEAVVTLKDNIIQFVSIHGSEMTPSSYFEMSHDCVGITTKADTLYVTDGDTSLYVYDMECNLLKSITKDFTGNEIFAECNYITVNDYEDKAYVSDWYGGVVCLNAAAQYQSYFNDSELDGVNGICVDGKHNVFVAGHESHNVVQFSEGGKKIGVVIKQQDGLQYPQAVLFNKKWNILFVTMFESDEVKMYKLE